MNDFFAEIIEPDQTWCGWCGRDSAGGFCNVDCMRKYWNDVRKEREKEAMQTGWALTELHESGASADDIVAAVAEAFALTSAEVLCKSRTKEYILPRQIAIYLIRELRGLSWPEVGRAVLRDHGTCMHAYAVVAERTQRDGKVASVIAQLRTILAPERIAAE